MSKLVKQNPPSSSNPVAQPIQPPHTPQPSISKKLPASSSSAVNANKPKNQSLSDAIRDEIIFETFYHQSGKTYYCIFANGERHYLDGFDSGQWLAFPKDWYDKGVLVIDDMENHDPDTTMDEKNDEKIKDDREGTIKIPGKGEFITYIFERKQNVHCYYDKNEGAWISLPILWELYSKSIVAEIRKVKDVCPQWKDDTDILAALRVNNYNVDNCINNFAITSAIDDSNKKKAGPGKSIVEEAYNLQNMEKKIKHLTTRLNDFQNKFKLEVEQKEFFQKKSSDLEEMYATLKAAENSMRAQITALQKAKPPEPKKVKTFNIDPENFKKLIELVTSLKKIQLQAKSEVKDYKVLILENLNQITVNTKSMTKYVGNHGDELEALRVLYRREALQRKLIYNQLQEIRGNIRVFVRIRKDPKSKSILKVMDDDIAISLSNGILKQFQFDKIFSEDSTQDDVYAEVSPIITSCADGYNVTILAYGQTGSGKTFTMQGLPNAVGVNKKAIEELLKICNARTNINYNLSVTMVEIYNENVQDLLSPKVETVELRATGSHSVSIMGVTSLQVKTTADIMKIMNLGNSNRKVAETKMNSTSSRSHLLLTVTVVGVDNLSGLTTKGQLNMVDLAGSERVSKTDASGARLTEAAFINKSLTSLGQVFQALRTNQLHIPYRNSKLTHILEPSLGGDAKACLFVNISPDEANVQESLSSLQFGSNARQVALGQAKANVQKTVPSK